MARGKSKGARVRKNYDDFLEPEPARPAQQTTSRRRGAPPSSKSAPSSTATWKYIALLVLLSGGALQVLLPLFDSISEVFSTTYHDLSVSDMPTLNRVFKSGEPWLVLCKSPQSNSAFYRAVTASGKLAPGTMNFGLLDCEDLLPSGKNVYDRFNLTQPTTNVPHAAFIVANGRVPTSVPMGYFVKAETGQGLLDYAVKNTKKSYKSISTSDQLRKLCLRKKECGLLFNLGKISKDETASADLQAMVNRNRLVDFVAVDADAYRLNMENVLPPVDGGVSEFPRFIYFRRIHDKEELKVGAKALRKAISPDSVTSFIEELRADDSNMAVMSGPSLPALGKRPTKAGMEAKERQRKKKAKKNKQKQKKEEDPTWDDMMEDIDEEDSFETQKKKMIKQAAARKKKIEEEKQQKQQEERLANEAEAKAQQQKERTRARREKMDEEQRERNYAKVIEDGDEEEEETADDEEEVIDLD